MNSTKTEYRRPLPMKVSPAEIPDYQASDRPAGHEGEPPVHAERKTLTWEDGKRVAGSSPFNINHSRVCYLFNRGRIEKRQLGAAERLTKDWELSLIQPRASSVIVGGGSSGGDSHPNDAKWDAMQRHGNAMDALGAAWPLIELVVEQNMSVEKASGKLGFHPKYGHGMLWVALHVLADHYKLPRDA